MCEHTKIYKKKLDWMDTKEVHGNGLPLGEVVWKWDWEGV